MRAGCSASTFILVAAWEQSLHPGSPGHRLANREGPVKAEIAVRKTGLLTAGRNPGGQNGPSLPTVDDQGNNVAFEGQLSPARAVRYSATSTGAAGSQRTPASPA